jgi:phosphatidylinositol alpha-mannosyltransferase
MQKGLFSIAVFSHHLPVEGQKRGGIERIAHDLAQGLARRGHRVTVWSHDPKPPGAAYAVEPLPWRRFAASWLGLRLTMGYLGNVLAILPRYRDADVIVAHGDSLLLPLLGKPVIRVMHGSARAEARSAKSPWRFLAQSGIYLFELLTGLTQRGCVGVSQNTLRDNPFVKRVIPNGVDLSVFQTTTTGKTLEPSILFVGTLDGRKRGRLLLEWFAARIQPRHPSAKLMLVSPPGPPVRGVEYFGGVSTTELARLYQRAWVYASPSAYEGFGLPYLEAMASGTPVVATPNPGSREVLDDGRFGILADVPEFPEAVNDLLANEAARARWAAVGLERARHYSLEVMLDRYEQLVNELCDRPRRR